jgi:protein required for attachment to host cells
VVKHIDIINFLIILNFKPKCMLALMYNESLNPERNPITWILVADGERAQMYMRQNIKSMIPVKSISKRPHFQEKLKPWVVPISGMEWQAESTDNYEIGNVKEQIKFRFMRKIASQINIAYQNKSFERLALVAPPKLLGELKKQLDESVLKSVVAELPKDITHYQGRDLAVHLSQLV